MENVVHRLTLDLIGPDVLPRVEVQKDNARTLVVSLIQGGRPYRIAGGVTAVFSGRKADGVPLFNACAVEKNTVRYEFTPQTTNVPGIVECEILLYSGDERLLASPRFELAVDDLIHQEGDVPESAPELDALTQMVSAGTALMEDVREALGEWANVEEFLEQAETAAENAQRGAEQAAASADAAAESAQEAAFSADTSRGAASSAEAHARTVQTAAANAAGSANAASNAATAAAGSAQEAAESAASAEDAAAVSRLAENSAFTSANKAMAAADAAAKAVEDALAQAKASGEFDGQRGNGILKVATEPAAYAVNVGGKISIARMALETIRAEAGVDEVLVGDLIAHGHYLYHVYYVDIAWAFMDTYVSVRGEPGMAPPLVLDAQTDYTADSDKGDEALEAIIRNRQILVRVPNADGGKHTAIYSPVLMHQLPNYENNYLYLFYLRDEKQDLSGVIGYPIQMPTYGELKMLLSKTYNESPLVNPQEHLSDTTVYLKGDPGRGIQSIARTGGNGAAGTVDEYTITYTDGTTGTYQVRNGANGSNGVTPHIGANSNWYIGTTDTGVSTEAVLYTAQTLTDEQKVQAKDNIGAGAGIVSEASGEVIVLSDSSDQKIQGLKIFGKTIQNGTPTPEAPVELVNVGDGGSISVRIGASENDENPQVFPVPTSNGLAGIPVTSGGNYTDGNGQQRICDVVDFAKGKHVQRVMKKTLTGADYWVKSDDGYFSLSIADKIPGSRIMCADLPYTSSLRDENPGWWSDNPANRLVAITGYSNMSISEFKEHLNGNPIDIMYGLVTPIETDLTAEKITAYAALHTNKPNTTIYNDAGAGMAVEYVADTKLYIDNKFAELAAALVNNT